MMVRRRADDDDWNGVRNRTPWDGPSSQWGEDVNTRLGSLELAHQRIESTVDDIKGKVDKLAESFVEPLRVFRSSKKFGLALITLALFFGWNGVVSVFGWIKQLMLALAK